jgi:hypothetical protein
MWKAPSGAYLQCQALSTRPSTLLPDSDVVQYTIRCKHGAVICRVSEWIFVELVDRHIMY